MNPVEMIVFVNKKSDKFIIESSDGNYYSFDEFKFCVGGECKVDSSLLEFDGWGIPQNLNIEKAFKPLKFYKVVWYEIEMHTPDCHEYWDAIISIEEVEYLNQ